MQRPRPAGVVRVVRVVRAARIAATGVARRLAAAALLMAALGARAADATPPPVEANVATQAQLERLRGIGVETSERILAERAKAPFRDWPDFMRRVKGLRTAQAARLSAEGLTVAGRRFEPAAR